VKTRSTVLPALAAGAAALVLSCSGGGGEKGGGKGGPIAFPVETAEVKSRPVEYTVTSVGSVDAFEKVQVTARVAGVVEQVKFVEGESVEAGRPLVEIELRRYQLFVEAARANLQKAEAAKADAEAALARRRAVVEKNPGLIPGEEIATFATRVQTAAADVAQAASALDQAELNLRDAFVRAPVAGRIETRTVTTGQYVAPGGVLATLVRRDPLLLRFQVPSEEARSLKPGLVARFRVPGDATEFTARITHVAGAAEASSRMVAVTAEVDDARRAQLRPGAFADVRVPVGGPSQAPVIPQTAIRPSERGFLAFVVEGDKARERLLTLGLRTAEGLVEVRAGLKPGEQLVVRGAEALRDGFPVKVSAPGAAPTPDAPSRPEARG
jgi:multidrug efflux system membrane fusion protein